jgi:putative transposase
MTKGLKRYYDTGDLHFITCSCYKRQPLLGTPQRRDLLLTVLERVRRRYRVVVIGYVVMPEHFHLLITEPQRRTPSTLMQALKLGFARRVLAPTRRHPEQAILWENAAHIWQPRFYDFNVWSGAQAHREAALHAQESREARSSGRTGPVAMEQLPLLCLWRSRTGPH